MNMTQLLNNLRLISDIENGREPRIPAEMLALVGRQTERLADACVARIEAEGYVVAELLTIWETHL